MDRFRFIDIYLHDRRLRVHPEGGYSCSVPVAGIGWVAAESEPDPTQADMAGIFAAADALVALGRKLQDSEPSATTVQQFAWEEWPGEPLTMEEATIARLQAPPPF